MRDWYWKNVFSNREGEWVMVGERLTMTDASSRGFERVAASCALGNDGVGVQRVPLAAPTSVASERTARRVDRRGSINSQSLLGRLSSQRSSMSLSLVSNAYLDEQSTKIQSKPVPWEVSPPHPLFAAKILICRIRDINVQDWSQRTSLLFSRK